MRSSIQDLARRALGHPVVFLLAINVACAALGLIQFAVTLAWLLPTDFARIGILVAIASLLSGLLDVRLADLTTRLYFARPVADPEGRCDILRASLLLHAGQAVIAATAIAIIGGFVAALLSDNRFAFWWIAVVATRAGSGFVTNILTTFLRLAGAFQASGWLRLATQAVASTAMLLGFWIRPDLDGYFLGAALTTTIAPILAFSVAVPLVNRAHGSRLLLFPKRPCLGEFLAATNFLAKGSLVGIGKLLSRSGDQLVVAALTDDTTTGLYRVARQAYDTLAGLSDAVHQFYTPTIVDCLNRGQTPAFRKHRGRLMLIGVAAAGGAVLASWLVLRPLAAARYPHYVPALPAFEIFAALLVVNLGIHGWLWPTLIASGRIGWFGVLGIAGAVTQLGALGLLAWLGRLDIVTAAAAAWIMAAITYGPLLPSRAQRHLTEFPKR